LRNALLSVLTLCLCLSASRVRADSGATFGESARAAGLAGSVTARRGDTSAISLNPGAITSVRGAQLNLTAHYGYLDVGITPAGRGEQEFDRHISGASVALVGQLPGPAWLQRVRVGGAFHVPTRYALRVSFPYRRDEPLAPLYSSRAERLSFAVAMAVELFEQLSLGVGATLTPGLHAPNQVSLSPYLDDEVEDRIVIDASRSIEQSVAYTAGFRAPVHRMLSLGVAFRQQVMMQADGASDIAAGVIALEQDTDFADFMGPHEVAGGAALTLMEELTLSADVIWAKWSNYRTPWNEKPDPRFKDTTSLRAAGSWRVRKGVPLRLGYGFLPSPVPEQVGDSNYVDGDRHLVTLGAGVDLRELTDLGLGIDFYVRSHWMQSRTHRKDVDRLRDADVTAVGQQIDNRGYPSFESRGRFYQVGLSLNVYVGAAGAKK
jgi:hypothetical protein